MSDLTEQVSFIAGPSDLISGRRLAEILGLTVRRVDQLVDEGTLARSGQGFRLAAAVSAYIRHLKADTPATRAKYELAATQLKALEMRNAHRRGELLTRAEVRRKLERRLNELLNLKCAASQLFHELKLLTDETTATRIANDLYQRLNADTLAISRAIESAFPKSRDEPADDLDAEDGEDLEDEDDDELEDQEEDA